MKTLLDALHAELLTDVQRLAAEVEELNLKLPAITADMRGSAGAVTAAADKTLSDFEAMGHALVKVIRQEVVVHRAESIKANDQAANATRGALGQFTKYFWLLIGLLGANSILLVGLTAVVALRS
ncbi:hypothetical protein [Variovorax ginsengisoli]|uniref:Uncharacterized protein n=1 Tax=Variovorax ginsengisoli TaxID=363844 RepID=A0ABT9SF57_9BURK|nr:hypothetical protein [Variovorax ginsengisoli]MDP9902418.1 hypothetical protein [Variovorax ginsengisoli]